ncbi:asparagine synthase (glutamine-hydrolyzing) [Ferruginibacter sp. SUN106]|uniref:asparagine synthase (glutamine-hydrolyzing) n=1 Tax=Ferruginibacter sp. SUN106 TaxID=2978348 RepID=UPI003D36F46B
MCGIAGILATSSEIIPEVHLQKMTRSIAHRGPDGEGIWKNEKGNVLLGHRRLSIIDLSNAAAQPMQYAARYIIIHNGEIYNYIELKEELAEHGYSFRSKSDTEVIVAAYDFWKEDCLKHFDGMFSFAIWDEKEEQLFAARDRFGEKPFYYYQNEGYLFFASEMKALWSVGVEKIIEEKMLLNYLALGHVQNSADKEQTFFKDIYSLPPAHYLLYQPQQQKLMVKKYWRIDKEICIDINAADAIEKFNQLFNTSISRRLRSDVTVGTSLSGGLDSSSILATMQELKFKPGEIKTFSAIFPGFEKDESSYINLLSSGLNVPNFTTQPAADGLIKDFEKLCYHQEEPFQSGSIYAQYKVFELAKQQQVTVLLDGQGADETLAGYHKYIQWFLQEVLSRNKLGAAQREKKALHKNNIAFNWSIKNYFAAYLPMHAAMQLEKNEYLKTIHQPDINPDFLRLQRGKEWEGIHKPVVTKLNDILHFNTSEAGLEELLRYADRNSMAHDREVRLPFLDHKLVEFIFSLPSTFKIHDGWTKWLLRKAMDKKLPHEIVWRKDKVGYEPPQQVWLENKTLQEYIHEAKKKLVTSKILRPNVLQKNIVPKTAHADNNFDWRYLCAAQII